MPASDPISILNRVLAILRRSFPQYARYSRPFIPPGRERAMQAIADVAITEEKLAEQVNNQIIALGGLPNAGDFPTEFTDTHDLGIDYVIAEAMGYQRQDLVELESCRAALGAHTEAEALVAEIVNIAKRHLKTFEELHVEPGASTKFTSNGAAGEAASPPAATAATPAS
jgi:bacterioferritin (cytochrome b1)